MYICQAMKSCFSDKPVADVKNNIYNSVIYWNGETEHAMYSFTNGKQFTWYLITSGHIALAVTNKPSADYCHVMFTENIHNDIEALQWV
jgi:hypothetical protein